MSAPHKEYAKALFELSLDGDNVEVIQSAYESFTTLLTDDFVRLLTHPNILKADKKDILKTIPLDSLFANFLYVLVDHNRVNILKMIMDEFTNLVNDHKGVVDVKVYTNTALSETQKERISSAVSKKLSKKL